MTMPINYSQNTTTVKFHDKYRFFVKIETENLYMRSVVQEDFEDYHSLFGNAEEVKEFATGQAYTVQKTFERISNWAQRWLHRDPYSGFAIFKREESASQRSFIGHIVLGYSDEGAGVSELAFIIKKAFRNQGFGSQAVNAIVNHYAPAIVEKGYTLEGEPLRRIIATTKIDNQLAIRVLEKAGMQKEEKIEKFEATRYLYSIALNKTLSQVIGRGRGKSV